MGTKSVRNTTKLAQDCRICKHTTRHITIWVDKKSARFLECYVINVVNLVNFAKPCVHVEGLLLLRPRRSCSGARYLAEGEEPEEEEVPGQFSNLRD